MERKERKKISEQIIKAIDASIDKVKTIAPKFQEGTEEEQRKIVRDVLNHYIDLKFVPEVVEGAAIEKGVGVVIDYLKKVRK